MTIKAILRDLTPRSYRDWVHRSARFLRSRVGNDIWVPVQVKRKKECLGNEGAAWTILPDNLDERSIVYLFGVGQDISFDLGLIGRFGLKVHAFDPTPRSIDWVKLQQLPVDFVMHEFGVCDYDGTAIFNTPADPKWVSYSLATKAKDPFAIEAPVRKLSSIMKSLGHHHIDLLKLDIEGAEYQVIDDILKDAVKVEQLCVEFHHYRPDVGLAATMKAIHKLNESGYKIFDVSPSGQEYSFLKLSGVE